jgi:hypothetical protein
MAGKTCAGLLLVVLLPPMWWNGDARAQPKVIDQEYLLKAAYLYNFGLFVTWPNNAVPGNNFVIGVLGKDPFGKHLDDLAQLRTINKRKIVIHRFGEVNEYKPCHILFISNQPANPNVKERPEDRLAAVQAKLKGSPVLLVTEKPGLATLGAAINLYLDKDDTVKFEINPAAAKESGLELSSKLFQVGKLVQPKG